MMKRIILAFLIPFISMILFSSTSFGEERELKLHELHKLKKRDLANIEESPDTVLKCDRVIKGKLRNIFSKRGRV